jgi:hypothetical protein
VVVVDQVEVEEVLIVGKNMIHQQGNQGLIAIQEDIVVVREVVDILDKQDLVVKMEEMEALILLLLILDKNLSKGMI